MALQLGALRDALLDAGAAPDKADKASEEAAGYEREIAAIRSDVRLLTWMVGLLYAPVLAILAKLLHG